MNPDLKLILDGDVDRQHVEIQAWSQVMSNASPYFQKLLLPGRFAEGDTLKSTGYLELPLPETNAQAMKILCDIFHLRTDDIPVSDITSSQLFDIAVLVDKFSCERSLRPWPDMWLAQDHIISEMKVMIQSQEKPSVPSLIKWICICQNLGCKGYLAPLTSLLLKYHTAQDLAQTDGVYIDVIPQTLLEDIGEKRTRLISEFHTITLQFAEQVEHENTCKRARISLEVDDWLGHDISLDETFHCSSITLDNFLLATRAILGSEWRLLGSWIESIDKTYHQLQEVAEKLTGPSEIARGGLRKHRKISASHAECSLKAQFGVEIDRVMRTVDS